MFNIVLTMVHKLADDCGTRHTQQFVEFKNVTSFYYLSVDLQLIVKENKMYMPYLLLIVNYFSTNFTLNIFELE